MGLHCPAWAKCKNKIKAKKPQNPKNPTQPNQPIKSQKVGMVVRPLGSPWRLKGLVMAQHPPPNRFLLWADPSTRAAWEGGAVGGGLPAL